MNNIRILLFQIILLFCNCGEEKKIAGEHEFNELIDLARSEKAYYIENKTLTNFSLDTIFFEHNIYRGKMIEKLKQQFSNIEFERAFLFEDFFIRADNSESERAEFNHSAIVYMEDNINHKFLSIEVSRKNENVQLEVIKLNQEEKTKVRNWLLSKMEHKHFETNNHYNTTREQYLFISKLTEKESLCRLIVNPLWVGMMRSKSPIEYENLQRLIEDVSEIYYYTGKGVSF